MIKSIKLFSDNKTDTSKVTYYTIVIASIVISILIIPTFVVQFLLAMQH